MSVAAVSVEPMLPEPAGPVSAAVVETLRADPSSPVAALPSVHDCDPYGIDLQLALYTCYELHYRGFADVDPRWEWNPELLRLRAQMEDAFLADVRREVGEIEPGVDVAAEMDELTLEPIDGNGPSYYLRDTATWDQMREYFVQRSVYHLKEADPHAFAIPRLTGHAKAAFVAIEYDEFGSGRGDFVHQRLYADLLTAAGLDADYLGYLDHVAAEALATVNLMSLFGLHRRLRGAAIGHFAAIEITSSPGSRRIAEALDRIGAPDPCAAFYREHVVADAVHEQVVRHDVVGDLVATEPALGADVLFGMRACAVVEDRLAEHVMGSWTAGRSSLRRPLV